MRQAQAQVLLAFQQVLRVLRQVLVVLQQPLFVFFSWPEKATIDDTLREGPSSALSPASLIVLLLERYAPLEQRTPSLNESC